MPKDKVIECANTRMHHNEFKSVLMKNIGTMFNTSTKATSTIYKCPECAYYIFVLDEGI
jgi:hypothetical protein